MTYQTGAVEHLTDRLDPDVTWQAVRGHPSQTAEIFQVPTFDGDRTRMQDYQNPDDALRAGGLSDRAAWADG